MSATTLPTPEQLQRTQWDLLLTDLELRIEQVRQLKTFEPRRLMMTGITTGAAVFGSGAATLGLILHLTGKL